MHGHGKRALQREVLYLLSVTCCSPEPLTIQNTRESQLLKLLLNVSSSKTLNMELFNCHIAGAKNSVFQVWQALGGGRRGEKASLEHLLHLLSFF